MAYEYEYEYEYEYGISQFTTWRKLQSHCAILTISSLPVLFVHWNGNIPIIIIIIIIIIVYIAWYCCQVLG
jgi:hypothetical protein